MFGQIKKKAGIKTRTFHDLRRRAITNWFYVRVSRGIEPLKNSMKHWPLNPLYMKSAFLSEKTMTRESLGVKLQNAPNFADSQRLPL